MFPENKYKNLQTVFELYQYLDDLFEQEVDADTLFASGYLRGLLSLAATDFGDEQQNISQELITKVDQQLVKSKSELSPQDSVIVQNFWLNLQTLISR